MTALRLMLVLVMLGACGTEMDVRPVDADVANFTPTPDARTRADARVDGGWENPPAEPFAACLWLCDFEQRAACPSWSRGDCRNECYAGAGHPECAVPWTDYLNCKTVYLTVNANVCVPPGLPSAEVACEAKRDALLSCVTVD